MFWPFRRSETKLMPLPPRMPKMPIRPPRGFRFATNPPSVDKLVHLDNDHPYIRARAGEKLLILSGWCSPDPIGTGKVVGRMTSDDPRARATFMSEPGIFFENETGKLEWRGARYFWRREDGTLTFRR